MTDTDDQRLVLLADAARAFGRTPRAFRFAATEGRIRVTRVGRGPYMVTMAEAADYVARQQPNHYHPKSKEGKR